MEKEKKSVWGIVLKLIVALATAVAGVLGVGACA